MLPLEGRLSLHGPCMHGRQPRCCPPCRSSTARPRARGTLRDHGHARAGRRAAEGARPEKDLAALEPAATLEDGVAVQYAMDAARASHANDGKWIRAWNDNLETEDC